MIKLGIYMTLAGFMASLSSYVLNVFISNRGGVEQVGLYKAGWGVIGQYTSIVFAAMATDYFPRLAAIKSNNAEIKVLVRQQGETALLILTPLLSLLIVAMPLVIRILYTPAFLPVVMFANLTILGMQFKAISWAMGYVYLAKGDGQLFLILEVISGIIILLLNLLFYFFFGLNGLGVSFILSHLLGTVLSYYVLKLKYSFSLPKNFNLSILTTYGFVVLSFLTIFLHNSIHRYFVGAAVFVNATIFCIKKLNELMDLKTYILNKFRK